MNVSQYDRKAPQSGRGGACIKDSESCKSIYISSHVTLGMRLRWTNCLNGFPRENLRGNHVQSGQHMKAPFNKYSQTLPGHKRASSASQSSPRKTPVTRGRAATPASLRRPALPAPRTTRRQRDGEALLGCGETAPHPPRLPPQLTASSQFCRLYVLQPRDVAILTPGKAGTGCGLPRRRKRRP